MRFPDPMWLRRASAALPLGGRRGALCRFREPALTDQPELSRPPRLAPVNLRHRTALVAGGIGTVLLALLVAWMVLARPPSERPIVLVGPQGSRLVVDGAPLPVLGGDGTHLLRLAPGSHELAVTLNGDTILTDRLLVDDQPDTLRLELRYDRVYGRWHLVEQQDPTPPARSAPAN